MECSFDVAGRRNRRPWFLMPTSHANPEVVEICADADPRSPIEHFVVCPVCGQIFDCRDERQLEHHTEALHAPLL